MLERSVVRSTVRSTAIKSQNSAERRALRVTKTPSEGSPCGSTLPICASNTQTLAGGETTFLQTTRCLH